MTLFDPDPATRARHTDPATSHAAAHAVSNRESIAHAILETLAVRSLLTDEDLVERLTAQGTPSGIRTRRSELVSAGYVVKLDERGTTASGRRCARWGITVAGIAALR